MAPGTLISVQHSSGTSWKPSALAASAGNSARRSAVAEKITLITSSVLRPLRFITSVTSSAVPSSISSRSSASPWMAPLMALTATIAPFSPALDAMARLHADRGIQVADLGDGQPPGAARPQRSEADRPDLRPYQADDRVTGLGQHPPDNVLASFVQSDLDEDPLPGLLDHAKAIGSHGAVIEFDARGQPAGQVLRNRSPHFRQVSLQHAVTGMGESMRELTVICQQNQALGLKIKPTDMEQAFAVIGD